MNTGERFCNFTFWPNEEIIEDKVNRVEAMKSIHLANIVIHNVYDNYEDCESNSRNYIEKHPYDKIVIAKLGVPAKMVLNPSEENVIEIPNPDDNIAKEIERSRQLDIEAQKFQELMLIKRQQVLAKRGKDPITDLTALCAAIGSLNKELNDLSTRLNNMIAKRTDIMSKYEDIPKLCLDIITRYKEMSEDIGVEIDEDMINEGIVLKQNL
ncbi:hypothetical protein [Trichoplusia ni ascovirus 6b]|nr:hypothetical protein [Trichoplusia ni ascovirus 6b]